MENRQLNPLFGYFRQPAIYLNLPSKGKWWEENALELPATGEIPIFPMTTRDEVILRTPDALLNGQGVVDVIQSCCPSIKNAWGMPSVDVDAVLIAIRIASYGNKMEFESKCGNCGAENSHDVDLSTPLSNISCPNYDNVIKYKTLKIKLKPQHYFNANQANLISFEEEKLRNIIGLSELEPEDKVAKLTESMQKLVDLSAGVCANSTDYIEVDSGDRVHDFEFIKEFYKEAESNAVAQVQAKLTELNEQTKMKPLKLGCIECQKQYSVSLTFDYTSFFGKGF